MRQQIIRVNAPTTFALRWLLPQLSNFQFSHPAVEVRLTTSDEPIEGYAKNAMLRFAAASRSRQGTWFRQRTNDCRATYSGPWQAIEQAADV